MPTGSQRRTVQDLFLRRGRDEPSHVHVERENKVAKYWLDPVRLSRSGDFGRKELRRIETIVSEHSDQFLEAWNELFAD